MKRLIRVIMILITFIFTACSTVLNTTTQEIEIKSNPANAKITIDGKKFGLTPQVVNLERGSNHIVKLELDGYEVYETQITRKISVWFWGNVLNGFIPGMVTDMFTGSMYNLLPENISVDLIPAKQEKGKK
ncbi:MAG: PEGA domain-containing protein [Melioribacteraceae bacterium]|nr:PEGA domain-containing protein [Melioribacteraceae bacterium]